MSDVSAFFQDLAAYPVLSDQEARAAFVAYRAGDQARGHALVYSTLQEARPLLLRYSRATRMEAEDLVQEAAVLLLSCLQRMPTEIRRPNGYLFRALHLHLNDVYHAAQQRHRTLFSLDVSRYAEGTVTYADTLPSPVSVPLSPEARAFQRRRLAALYRAFRALSTAHQQTLKDAYGLRFEVVTRRRGQPYRTTTLSPDRRYHRRKMAEERLRRQLETMPRCQVLVPKQ